MNKKQGHAPQYETRTRNVTGQIRAAGTEKAPKIEAYFAVFGDRYEFAKGCYETIDPAAFDGQLNGDVRALADHDSRLVLGRTTAGTLTLRADAHGLWGSISINEKDQDAMNLYARVQRGDVSQCSFGFEILDEECITEADGSLHYVIRKVKLYEVSVVTFPAYKDTIAQARSQSVKEFKQRDFERWKAEMLAKLRKTGKKQ